MTNLEVHVGDEVHAGDLGDDGKSLRIVPGVVGERRVSILPSTNSELRISGNIGTYFGA